jgi:hypothetical protein
MQDNSPVIKKQEPSSDENDDGFFGVDNKPTKKLRKTSQLEQQASVPEAANEEAA